MLGVAVGVFSVLRLAEPQAEVEALAHRVMVGDALEEAARGGDGVEEAVEEVEGQELAEAKAVGVLQADGEELDELNPLVVASPLADPQGDPVIDRVPLSDPEGVCWGESDWEEEAQ